MSDLSREEQELVLDFYFRCGADEQIYAGRDLIAANPTAAKLYADLEATLKPLDSIKYEPCPENLFELTIAKLKLGAQNIAQTQTTEEQTEIEQTEPTQQTVLHKLLLQQAEKAKPAHWPELARRLATAAVFMVVGTALLTGYNALTHYANRIRCQDRLGNEIYTAMTQYAADHDGQLPAVAMASGQPWSKVGYQGQENCSNTRHLWLLVKNGYLNPQAFVCPSEKKNRVNLTEDQIAALNDFPDRKNVTYSLRLICDQPVTFDLIKSKVLISDLNPLFEKLPADFNVPLNIKLDPKLLTRNSPNHRGKGQNVLFGDGSVHFMPTRKIGLENDDIFTLRNTEVYQGIETPACANDAFLAP